MAGETEVWAITWLTLGIAGRAVLLGFPLALVCALLLARRRFRGRAVLDAAVHLPLVLPPVLVGWLLLLVFGVRGPVGAWLSAAFGIRLVFTSWGAALACATMALPLMVRPLQLAFESIDSGLPEAARTLGAGPLDRFATVVLPLAAPGLVASVLVGFAAALGEFGAVITFAANVPGQTQTLALAIYAALQTPDGERLAARLAIVSIALAFGFLLAGDAAGRWLRARVGR